MESVDKPDGASGPDGGASNDDTYHHDKRKQGRGRGNPYKGRRNIRNNNKQRQKKKPDPVVSKERFAGQSEDLEGYV
jgi:hypothetical protein